MTSLPHKRHSARGIGATIGVGGALSVGARGGAVERPASRPPALAAVDAPTATLRRILDEADFPTCTLVCDIEGGELALVEHELETLRERVRTIILELHPGLCGPERARAALDALRSAGFELRSDRNNTVVLQSSTVSPAPSVAR